MHMDERPPKFFWLIVIWLKGSGTKVSGLIYNFEMLWWLGYRQKPSSSPILCSIVPQNPFFSVVKWLKKKASKRKKEKNKVRPWPWLPYHDLRSEMNSSRDPARRFWVYIIEKANTRYQSLPMTLLLSFLLTLFIDFFIYNKREQRVSFHKGKPLSH